MWRWAAVAFVAALLAVPAVGSAAMPASPVPFREVGPPATKLHPDSARGAGTHLYVISGLPFTGESLWSSADTGATWHETPLPQGDELLGLVVSRDDPLTAYAPISPTAAHPAGVMRTRDGGATWSLIPTERASRISAVAPGDPLHVIVAHDHAESYDGGVTFTALPAGQPCAGLDPRDDPTSPTGQRLYCFGIQRDDPTTLMGPPPVPIAQGLVGSPDTPSTLAIASGALLGDLHTDGTWQSVLAPTGAFGPIPGQSIAGGAWPALGGTIFYGLDTGVGATWVRRGNGRWWRLREHGHDLRLITPLDATHALVVGWGPPPAIDESLLRLAVIDLTRLAVDPPVVTASQGLLACVVPWTSAEANADGYTWLRDGVQLDGANGSTRTASRYDRGHAITCRASASTSLGTTTATSTVFQAPGVRVPVPRPLLTGSPRVGGRLRCSARTHVTWLRGTALATHSHARTYVVRARDAGHALSCETRLSDGTRTRSRAVHATRG